MKAVSLPLVYQVYQTHEYAFLIFYVYLIKYLEQNDMSRHIYCRNQYQSLLKKKNKKKSSA